MADNGQWVLAVQLANATQVLKNIEDIAKAASNAQGQLDNLAKSASKADLRKIGTVPESSIKNIDKLNASILAVSSSIDSRLKPQLQSAQQLASGIGDEFAKKLGVEAPKAVEKVNESVSIFNKRIDAAIKRVIAYKLAFFALQGIKNVYSDIIDVTVRMDSVMTELKKVLIDQTLIVSNVKKEVFGLGIAYGRSAFEVADAVQIFAQQGKTMSESLILAEAAIVGANSANLTLSESTEALTAITKAYNLEAEEGILIFDKFQAVQAKSAVTAQDLANAFKVVGSGARVAGIGIDELNGYVTAIASVTRKSGTAVAQSLKTMFARLSQPRVNTVFETVADTTTESAGKIRPLSDVIAELAGKWDGLSRAQKLNIAQTVGGERRYADFIVLMENFNESLSASRTSFLAQGEAQRAALIESESLSRVFQSMRTSFEQLADQLGSAGFLTVLSGMAKGITAVVTQLSQPGFREFVTIMGYTVTTLAAAKVATLLYSSAVGGLKNYVTQTATAFVAAARGVKVSEVALTKFEKAMAFSRVGLKGLTSAFGPFLAITVALEALFYILGKRQKDQIKSENDMIKATANEISIRQQQVSYIKGLVSARENLLRITKKTISDSEKLVDTEKKLSSIDIDLIDHYDEKGKAILKSNDALKEAIKMQEDYVIMLQETNRAQADIELKKVNKDYDENIDKLNEILNLYKEQNKLLPQRINYFSQEAIVAKNRVGIWYNAEQQIYNSVVKNMKDISKEIIGTISKVDKDAADKFKLDDHIKRVTDDMRAEMKDLSSKGLDFDVIPIQNAFKQYSDALKSNFKLSTEDIQKRLDKVNDKMRDLSIIRGEFLKEEELLVKVEVDMSKIIELKDTFLSIGGIVQEGINLENPMSQINVMSKVASVIGDKFLTAEESIKLYQTAINQSTNLLLDHEKKIRDTRQKLELLRKSREDFNNSKRSETLKTADEQEYKRLEDNLVVLLKQRTEMIGNQTTTEAIADATSKWGVEIDKLLPKFKEQLEKYKEIEYTQELIKERLKSTESILSLVGKKESEIIDIKFEQLEAERKIIGAYETKNDEIKKETALNQQVKILQAQKQNAKQIEIIKDAIIIYNKERDISLEKEKGLLEIAKASGYNQLSILGKEMDIRNERINIVLKELDARKKLDITYSKEGDKVSKIRMINLGIINQLDTELGKLTQELNLSEEQYLTLRKIWEINKLNEKAEKGRMFALNLTNSVFEHQSNVLSVLGRSEVEIQKLELERLEARKGLLNNMLKDKDLQETIREDIEKEVEGIEDALQLERLKTEQLKQQNKYRISAEWAADIAGSVQEGIQSFREDVVARKEGIREIENNIDNLRKKQQELSKEGFEENAEEIRKVSYEIETAEWEMQQLIDSTNTWKNVLSDISDKFLDKITNQLTESLFRLGNIKGEGIGEFTAGLTVGVKPDEIAVTNAQNLVNTMYNKNAVLTELDLERIRTEGAINRASLESDIGAKANGVLLSANERDTKNRIKLMDQQENIWVGLNGDLENKMTNAGDKLNRGFSENTKLFINSFGATLGNILGTQLGGGGRGAATGSGLGSAIGSAIGTALIPGIGMAIGGLLGGLLGGFIGGKTDTNELKPLYEENTAAIERNTQALNRTVDSLDALASKFINAPSTFELPTYAGGGIAPSLSSGQPIINVNVDKNGNVDIAYNNESQTTGITSNELGG